MPKPMTYAEWHRQIQAILKKDGWKVDASLKVPYAQSPDGTCRLYFKKEAIWIQKEPTGKGWNVSKAQSTWMSRETSPQLVVDTIHRDLVKDIMES